MKNIRLNLIVLLFLFTALNLSCSKTVEPCVKKTWYQDANGNGKGNKFYCSEY